MRAARASSLLLALTAGCTSPPHSATTAPARHGSSAAPAQGAHAAARAKSARPDAGCTYRVAIVHSTPLELRVDARCEGAGTTGFSVAEPAALRFTRGDVGASPRALIAAKITNDGAAELSYTVDLAGLAREADEIDVARAFGGSVLAPASSFLLTPEPAVDGVPLRVRFDSPGIETGLRKSPDGDGYLLESHELKVATYTTFGGREARDLAVGEAKVRLVVLDGALDLPTDVLARWVGDAAGGVARFFGRPPEPRTLVVLAPVSGRHGIPFGKMLPESGPGLVVLVGEHTAPEELHADWVLVHELFHAGTPSYLGEGKWYDEGLATYFEPLIRVRLGWRSEADLWAEFLRDMPRGLDAMTRRGLAHPIGYSDVYWGGGLFCLLADLEARRSSAGAVGLEDGVRAVLAAGGVASEVWTLAHATEVTDDALGAPLLADLQQKHLERGSPVDLDGVFRELGVSIGRNGGVALDARGPVAAARHALVYGR